MLFLSNAKFNTINSFKIFPNPVKDNVSILLQNNSELKRVTLYNNLGKSIKTSNTTSLDVSNLSRGVYFY